MYVQEGTFEVASPELTGLLRDRSRPSVPSIGQVPRPDRADAGAVGPPALKAAAPGGTRLQLAPIGGCAGS